MNKREFITHEEDHILLKLSGDSLTVQESTKLITNALNLANQKGLPTIVWRTNIVKSKGNILDIPQLVNHIVGLNFKNKLALVFPAIMETVEFDLMITSAEQEGINIKSFSLIKNARKWISER